MKCVKNNIEVKRVSNEDAAKLVAEKGYEYVPKSEWKRFRDKQEN